MGRNGRVSHALDATAPVPYSTRSALSRPGRRERGPETGGARATVPRTGGASGEDAAGGSWVGQGELCVSRVSAQEVSVGAVSRPDVLAAVAVAEEHGAPSGSHSGAHRCAAQRGERRASLDRPTESRVAGLGNYFRTGNATRKFTQIDHYVWQRLGLFLARRRGVRRHRHGAVTRWSFAWFWGLGLYRLLGTVRYPDPAHV